MSKKRAVDAECSEEKRLKSLNTNVNVADGLKWSVQHAVRELLLNCTDETQQPPKIKYSKKKKEWRITNSTSHALDVFDEKVFEYASNPEKLRSTEKSGLFGYGLKDAIAILLNKKISYVAKSSAGTFTAVKDAGGLISIEIDPTSNIERGVEQILRRDPDCEMSEEEIENEIDCAKEECLFFHDELLSTNHAYRVSKSGTFLGTIYVCNNRAETEEWKGFPTVFVHNCGYALKESYPPLALIYNIGVPKEEMRERDRDRLPPKWHHHLCELIKRAPKEVILELLDIRQKHRGPFYEFDNQNINSYLNKRKADFEQSRKDQREAEEKARQQKETAAAAIAKADRLRSTVLDDDTPLARQLHDERIRLSAEEEKQAIQASKDTNRLERQAAKVAAGAPAFVDLPSVVALVAWTPTADDRKRFSIATSKHSTKEWKRSPSLQEANLMLAAAIPRERFKVVRSLRRMLAALDVLDVALSPAAPADNICSITLRAGCSGTDASDYTLSVPLQLDLPAIMRSAVLALSTSGLFPELVGLTQPEALAHLLAHVLQHLPVEPSEVASMANVDEEMSVPLSHGGAQRRLRFCPLFVCDEWPGRDKGGISAFNLQMVRGLASVMKADLTTSSDDNAASDSIVLFVLVLNTAAVSATTLAAWESERSQGIAVVDAALYRGQYEPRMSPTDLSRVSHIVGHAPITATVAAKLQQLAQLRHAKLWILNHVMPREFDLLKESGSQARYNRAMDKEDEIHKVHEVAARVLSVGQDIFNHYISSVPVQSKHHNFILPLNPEFISAYNLPRVAREPTLRQVLFVGRVEELLYAKGIDIAALACAEAHARLSKLHSSVQLTILGATAGSEVSTKDRVRDLFRKYHRDFHVNVRPFSSAKDVIDKMRAADLLVMPSRIEPFGLVAMEAIALGVPVLVTSNSGVARLLESKGFQNLCIQTSSANDFTDDDVAAWADAIISQIGSVSNLTAAFQRAEDLRSRLTTDLSPEQVYADIIQRGADDLA